MRFMYFKDVQRRKERLSPVKPCPCAPTLSLLSAPSVRDCWLCCCSGGRLQGRSSALHISVDGPSPRHTRLSSILCSPSPEVPTVGLVGKRAEWHKVNMSKPSQALCLHCFSVVLNPVLFRRSSLESRQEFFKVRLQYLFCKTFSFRLMVVVVCQQLIHAGGRLGHCS